MNTSDLVIDTYGLSKKYKKINALKPLDLKVARNSIFGFLGPNGAGKTTTIKLLLGLIRPTAGGGTVCGSDIVRDSLGVRRKIGYLAQNPRFYEHMTAREMLRFRARFFYRGPKTDIEQRIEETLELVGLDDKADRPIRSRSSPYVIQDDCATVRRLAELFLGIGVSRRCMFMICVHHIFHLTVCP